MNIALFLDAFTPMKNGVITSVLQLREGLEKKGHHVVIVAVQVANYENKDPNIMLVPMIPFDFGTKQGFGLGLANRFKLLRFMKEHKIELVHTHSEFGLGLAGKWAARKLGVPRVTTTHTMWEMYTNYSPVLKAKAAWRKYFRFFIKGTHVIVAPSLKAKKYDAMVVPEIPVQLIPNGISMEKFKSHDLTEADLLAVRSQYGLSASDRCIIFVGRVGPEKRVEELFDIVAPILRRHGDLRMLYVGDGPTLDQLRQKAAEQGLEKAFIFTGFVNWEEVFKLYSISELFLTASLSEVHPMTMIEGAMCGLPCLSRRDDSFIDLIHEGENGYLADTDEELAARVEEVLGDPKKRAAFSAASLLISRTFTADNHASRMETLYRKAIEFYPDRLEKLGDECLLAQGK
jgi:1,2-diacylglycerol 3-alpha-glucosyltransferase